ncbi:MAG: hypothetical protein EBU11_00050 [Gammaproteobacteria bacterium]|nr:hypothetical protein [Gammaproteobacteria bacterium]
MGNTETTPTQGRKGTTTDRGVKQKPNDRSTNISDRDVLTYHARDLAANPSKRVRLEGHADERGTREYNLALGERRANGILNYLIVNGAARNQIEVVSYGEERPADRSTGDAAYQRNRRVEIVDL